MTKKNKKGLALHLTTNINTLRSGNFRMCFWCHRFDQNTKYVKNFNVILNKVLEINPNIAYTHANHPGKDSISWEFLDIINLDKNFAYVRPFITHG